jgi:hypothetical protein
LLALTSHDEPDRWNASQRLGKKKRRFFVAPASRRVFLISTQRKNAGETPAPQHIARQTQRMGSLPNSESLARHPVKGGRKNTALCSGLRDTPVLFPFRKNDI